LTRPHFDEVFGAIEADGRSLLVSRESRVMFVEPFLVSTRCASAAVDAAVRRITLFAFVVAAVVGALIVARAAPAPLGGFALMWLLGALAGRLWARRRRRELGRAILDFDAETVRLSPQGGGELQLPTAGAVVTRETSNDEEAPLWLVIRFADGTRMRLCRGEERDVDRVLAVLRRFHVSVAASS
jgi:hypothetical protein